MLQWRTICERGKLYVKGTELEQALCGPNNRYAIISVRTYDKDRNADVRYRVRDAHTVSDADVKAGIRPKITGEFDTLDEAIKFCLLEN